MIVADDVLYRPERFACVYWGYDADGRLLYVGYTTDVDVRMKAHRVSSPWFAAASWVVIGPKVLRSEAMRMERDEITTRRPLFNVCLARSKYANEGGLYGRLISACGTVAVAAKLLNVGRATIYQWQRRGIPAYQVPAVRRAIKKHLKHLDEPRMAA